MISEWDIKKNILILIILFNQSWRRSPMIDYSCLSHYRSISILAVLSKAFGTELIVFLPRFHHNIFCYPFLLLALYLITIIFFLDAINHLWINSYYIRTYDHFRSPTSRDPHSFFCLFSSSQSQIPDVLNRFWTQTSKEVTSFILKTYYIAAIGLFRNTKCVLMVYKKDFILYHDNLPLTIVLKCY